MSGCENSSFDAFSPISTSFPVLCSSPLQMETKRAGVGKVGVRVVRECESSEVLMAAISVTANDIIKERSGIR